MARTKQREVYGSGSVSAIMTTDKNGKKVQKKNKQGQPVWRICISVGSETYTDKDGNVRKRQRKIQKNASGSLKEARAFAKTLTETYAQVDGDHAKDNFSSLVKTWSDSDELDCSDKQKSEYLRLLGYFAVFVDGKSIVELKKLDVEDALNKAAKRPNGKVLAPTTQSKMRTVVHRVFQYGVDMDYLTINPCRMPKRKKYGTGSASTSNSRQALSVADGFKLRSHLDEKESQAMSDFAAKEARQAEWGNRPNRSLVRDLSTVSCILAIRLMLATGIRRGEAFGLTWGNVDLENGVVRVSQTLTETMEVKSPKTDNGIRNLFIDENTLEHMRTWKVFQSEALSHIVVEGQSLAQIDSTPVFCSDKGGWIDPTNASRWWRDFRVEAGFGTLLIHELRHSQNTWLYTFHPEEEGLIKTRMGHSRASSISLVYLHEMPARDKHLADTIGRILYGSGEGVLLLPKTA